jgi:PAS domain S-box-containing protein
MSGYSESELLAMHFYDFTHPDDLAATVEAFNKVKSGRQPFTRSEHRLVCKDGSTIWVRSTFAGVKKRESGRGLSLIFGIVENISEQKKAEQDLRELQQHLQQSIELERLRLAQNLHDAPLQELYAVIYKLEEVRLKSGDPALVELLRQSVTEIKKTLDSLRSTASELRPPALSRFGLEKAIRSYAEDFKLRHPEIQLDLRLARDRDLLAEPVRLVLFRVFQESLANVVRHAHATQVTVLFSFDAEEARIEIADNGRGFNVPRNWMALARTGHYGLAGMAERVGAAGGTLSIDSSPETSTTVRVVIPCAGK